MLEALLERFGFFGEEIAGAVTQHDVAFIGELYGDVVVSVVSRALGGKAEEIEGAIFVDDGGGSPLRFLRPASPRITTQQ
ncbi:MAG: hypothetical protein WB561_10990 [Terracidiphilus sp.]